MKSPSFIIVGAPKSGTNSLREYLRSHPDIYIPPGEVHYFDKNYEKGIEWYLKFFDNAKDNQLIGEKTPNYMYKKEIAEKIFKLNNKIKLIFLLRNPVDRAYSNYWHNYKAGRLRNNFEESIKNDLDNIYVKNCIDNSKYKKAILNYKKIFPDEQILLLKSEDLKNKRKKTLNKVFNFLELEPFYPKNLNQEYNMGKISRSEFLTKVVKKFEIIKHKKNPLRYIIGPISIWNQKNIIERAFRKSKHYQELKIKNERTYPPIKKESRLYLEKIFEDEIKFWSEI